LAGRARPPTLSNRWERGEEEGAAAAQDFRRGEEFGSEVERGDGSSGQQPGAALAGDVGKALSDIGLVATLHPHTDTCIMTRDEAYAVMESVDARYVKFGPDVGQFAKMGYDPVKIVKDFAPVIRSVHLKDFLGGPHWAGYCPLGQGNVDIPAVMEALEAAKDLEFAMVELDGTPNAPMTPFETAKASKVYLEKLGYAFTS